MRKILICLLLLSNVAVAQPRVDICTEVAALAKEIMLNRQAGIPLKKSLDTVRGYTTFEELVVAAYKVPLYLAPVMQARTAAEFENQAFLACLTAND